MSEYDNELGAKPEEVKSAIKGWAIVLAFTLATFGVAYALIEL
jgi:hypothetical protein